MLLQSKSQPDILEVMADLSNDEVFTPPKVANAVLDLLPERVWHDPTLRWLDPGCKTGVFLREVTKRLITGLEEAIPDEQKRLDHILRNMVFGAAVTELTALMSRRTVYCSKDAAGPNSTVTMPRASGNIWFERVEHLFVNGRCSECGAQEEQIERENRENYAYAFIHEDGLDKLEKEIGMKFDVIVGNPPYQMTGGGGGTNDTPIYNDFFDTAKALNPQFITMIMPARWLAGGRGLDSFRATMLNDKRIRHLVDYPNAGDLFPGVEIKGGVCYLQWERDNPGDCAVTRVLGDVRIGPTTRDLAEFDIFVRDSRALSILHKVLAKRQPSVESMVSGDTPFGLATNFSKSVKKATASTITIHAVQSAKRVEAFVKRDEVPRGLGMIDVWKVLVPEAYGAGETLPHQILGQPIVAAPPSCCTQSYLVVSPFESEAEAASFVSYLRTRFFRFLVSQRKISQHAFKSTYTWVPQQSWDRTWTDAELYEMYDITKDEQAFIDTVVKEMPA